MLKVMVPRRNADTGRPCCQVSCNARRLSSWRAFAGTARLETGLKPSFDCSCQAALDGLSLPRAISRNRRGDIPNVDLKCLLKCELLP